MADRVRRPGRLLLDSLPGLFVASIVAGVAFALPMILSRELYFQDWRHHFYLVAKQARFVEANYSPTFFLNTLDRGWFYPFFAFYGGTLYFLTAVAAILLGSPWAAYVGSYALGAALAFGGWLWLAGLAGLRGWVRLLPGIVWISGHYFITNAYGRGAWPEFMAASSVPLALAGVWGNLTRPRLRICHKITVSETRSLGWIR